ncbi:hypothetical protein T01_3920 [Trichinella spiralis]|uniref:Uncharacterized protein n=1 Tax=Trichinella spiralis TaxID=6334 RepID=A0A0V1AMR2_TRISP|nr:hypothetical protein T01_3920 [Trichinella spiralis]
MLYAQKIEVPGSDEEDLHMINFLTADTNLSALLFIAYYSRY